MLGSISLLSGVLLRSANTTDAHHLPHMTDSQTRQTHLLLCLCISCSKVGTGKKRKLPLGFVFLAVAVQLWSNVLFTARNEAASASSAAAERSRSHGGVEWPAPGFFILTRAAARTRVQYASHTPPTPLQLYACTHTSHRLHTHTHSWMYISLVRRSGPHLQLRPLRFTVSQTSPPSLFLLPKAPSLPTIHPLFQLQPAAPSNPAQNFNYACHLVTITVPAHEGGSRRLNPLKPERKKGGLNPSGRRVWTKGTLVPTHCSPEPGHRALPVSLKMLPPRQQQHVCFP